MSKKKVEDFMKAGQNYFLVAKVSGASKEEKISKTGKQYTNYKATLVLNNNIRIFVNKGRFGGEEVQFIKDKFTEWDSIIEKVGKGEEIYVMVSGRKTGDKMFNYFTSYVKEDGNITYQVDNFLTEVKHFKMESDDEYNGKTVIDFKSGQQYFDKIDNKMQVTMFVELTDEDKIFLTDGKENYPNKLIVHIDKDKNQAKTGQLYEFLLGFEKGRKVSIAEGEFSWSGSETTESTYEPDKLIVKGVKVVGGVKMSSVSVKAEKEEEDDDTFPF